MCSQFDYILEKVIEELDIVVDDVHNEVVYDSDKLVEQIKSEFNSSDLDVADVLGNSMMYMTAGCNYTGGHGQYTCLKFKETLNKFSDNEESFSYIQHMLNIAKNHFLGRIVYIPENISVRLVQYYTGQGYDIEHITEDRIQLYVRYVVEHERAHSIQSMRARRIGYRAYDCMYGGTIEDIESLTSDHGQKLIKKFYKSILMEYSADNIGWEKARMAIIR